MRIEKIRRSSCIIISCRTAPAIPVFCCDKPYIPDFYISEFSFVRNQPDDLILLIISILNQIIRKSTGIIRIIHLFTVFKHQPVLFYFFEPLCQFSDDLHFRLCQETADVMQDHPADSQFFCIFFNCFLFHFILSPVRVLFQMMTFQAKCFQKIL